MQSRYTDFLIIQCDCPPFAVSCVQRHFTTLKHLWRKWEPLNFKCKATDRVVINLGFNYIENDNLNDVDDGF